MLRLYLFLGIWALCFSLRGQFVFHFSTESRYNTPIYYLRGLGSNAWIEENKFQAKDNYSRQIFTSISPKSEIEWKEIGLNYPIQSYSRRLLKQKNDTAWIFQNVEQGNLVSQIEKQYSPQNQFIKHSNIRNGDEFLFYWQNDSAYAIMQYNGYKKDSLTNVYKFDSLGRLIEKQWIRSGSADSYERVLYTDTVAKYFLIKEDEIATVKDTQYLRLDTKGRIRETKNDILSERYFWDYTEDGRVKEFRKTDMSGFVFYRVSFEYHKGQLLKVFQQDSKIKVFYEMRYDTKGKLGLVLEYIKSERDAYKLVTQRWFVYDKKGQLIYVEAWLFPAKYAPYYNRSQFVKYRTFYTY